MAWRSTGTNHYLNKSWPSSLTLHSSPPSSAYMRQWTGSRITPKVLRDFAVFRRPFSVNVLWDHRKKNNFWVSTVPADGLAPLGARTSAGNVMAKFGLRMNMWPALNELIHVLQTTTQLIVLMKYNVCTRCRYALFGCCYMMTSSNGNIFRVSGHLCGEFTGHRHKG